MSSPVADSSWQYRKLAVASWSLTTWPAGVQFCTRRRYSWTPLVHTQHRRSSTVTIGPATGSFAGASRARSWLVRLVGVARPHAVRLDGRKLVRGRWSYAGATRTLTIRVGRVSSGREATLSAA